MKLEFLLLLISLSCLQEVSGPVCALCLFIMKKLETLLPTNMTEVTNFFITTSGTYLLLYITSCRRYHPLFMSLQDALMKLMEDVCSLVPESYKERCDDFVSKYGEQIVEFLLSSAAPHTICTLLHLCLFEEQTVPGQLHLCNKYIQLSFVSSSWPEPHTSTAPMIPQRCSSPRTASRAARWLCWADFTWVQTPPNLRPPLSSSLCVSITPMPSPRSDPQCSQPAKPFTNHYNLIIQKM